MRKPCVYSRAPRTQCWEETGKRPIKTGWAETNKGTSDQANVRCRWSGKELNAGSRPDLFAPTPPLEVMKLVASEAASSQHPDVAAAVVDVRRTYFHHHLMEGVC
jgi:hypothetical protein